MLRTWPGSFCCSAWCCVLLLAPLFSLYRSIQSWFTWWQSCPWRAVWCWCCTALGFCDQKCFPYLQLNVRCWFWPLKAWQAWNLPETSPLSHSCNQWRNSSLNPLDVNRRKLLANHIFFGETIIVRIHSVLILGRQSLLSIGVHCKIYLFCLWR